MPDSSVFPSHADQVQRRACTHNHPMQPVFPDLTIRLPKDVKAFWKEA